MKSKEVIWEESYGCIDEITDKGIAVVGMGISYYPMCPHCNEYAYQESKYNKESYKCIFCGGLQKPIDWSKRPPSVLEGYFNDK